MKRVLLVGGGSGGHVYPLMAIADALKEKAPQSGVDLNIKVLGEGSFLKNAAKERGLSVNTIMAGKFRRYFSFLNFLDVFKFPIAFIQSLWHMFWFMPDVVFTKGGYASVLPALVAKLYFISLYTHESDSIPGSANKFIGKFANKVFISFENAAKYFNPAKTQLVGNPVRKSILNGNKAEALQAFNLTTDKKTIFVAGGSQGAKRINDIILESLIMLTSQFQIIHQCGNSQYSAVKAVVDRYLKEGEGKYAVNIESNYKLYGFLNEADLRNAYAASDVIISRAGASNLFEIAVLGKPAVVIPITNSTSNHQFHNASEFSKYGAEVIEEANLTSHILINQIEELLKPENYTAISAKIKGFAKPDAADIIAGQLLSK